MKRENEIYYGIVDFMIGAPTLKCRSKSCVEQSLPVATKKYLLLHHKIMFITSHNRISGIHFSITLLINTSSILQVLCDRFF